jgi:methionine synthase I (cobalamin-dependent)
VIELTGAGPDDLGDPAATCEPARGARSAPRLLERAKERPLVMDAAMGTRLLAAGLDLRNDDPVLWNLTAPDAVRELHRRDVAAGADAIVTNTFGANRAWLNKFGRSTAVAAINRRAVALARAAAGPARFVLGGIGPYVAQQPGAAAEQSAILAEAGADALLFETFEFAAIEPVLAEVTAALDAPIPLFVSLWRWPDPPGPAARRLLELGAAVLGMNCQPGVEPALKFATALDRVVSCPLLAKPSAGADNGLELTPALFAASFPSLAEHNVRFIGGCCGTTEQHVQALAAARAACGRGSFGNPIGTGS